MALRESPGQKPLSQYRRGSVSVVATAILTAWQYQSDYNFCCSLLNCQEVYGFVHCLRHDI